MFDPTKSDGQKLGNRRKKIKNIKKNINFLSPSSDPLPNENIIPFFFFFVCFSFFFFKVGLTYPLLLFSVCFSPETIYFVPVSVSSILNGNSLNI